MCHIRKRRLTSRRWTRALLVLILEELPWCWSWAIGAGALGREGYDDQTPQDRTMSGDRGMNLGHRHRSHCSTYSSRDERAMPALILVLKALRRHIQPSTSSSGSHGAGRLWDRGSYLTSTWTLALWLLLLWSTRLAPGWRRPRFTWLYFCD